MSGLVSQSFQMKSWNVFHDKIVLNFIKELAIIKVFSNHVDVVIKVFLSILSANKCSSVDWIKINVDVCLLAAGITFKFKNKSNIKLTINPYTIICLVLLL